MTDMTYATVISNDADFVKTTWFCNDLLKTLDANGLTVIKATTDADRADSMITYGD